MSGGSLGTNPFALSAVPLTRTPTPWPRFGLPHPSTAHVGPLHLSRTSAPTRLIRFEDEIRFIETEQPLGNLLLRHSAWKTGSEPSQTLGSAALNHFAKEVEEFYDSHSYDQLMELCEAFLHPTTGILSRMRLGMADGILEDIGIVLDRYFFNGRLGRVTRCKWTPFLHLKGRSGQTNVHAPTHISDPPYVLIEVDPCVPAFTIQPLLNTAIDLIATTVHEAAHALVLAHCIEFRWNGFDQRRVDYVLEATFPGGHGPAWQAIMVVLQEKLRLVSGDSLDLAIDRNYAASAALERIATR